jgi:two-component system phosphate regulon sensor histidine kinase PhoR
MRRPWKHNLIVKFFLYHLVVVLPICLLFYFYSASIIKNFYIKTLSQELYDNAIVLSRLLPTEMEGPALDGLCRDLVRGAETRITVIAVDGRVLCDSQEPSSTMENHAARPEVREALTTGKGSILRYSTTVRHDMLYVAIVARDATAPRIVRMAVPLDTVEATLASMRRTIFSGLIALSGAGLLLALFFYRKTGLRVKRMAEFSRRVSSGAFPQELLFIQGEDELSTLERHLNEMSLSLQEHIKGIIGEKEKVESILRCMTEGVLVVDTHGRIILLNDNAKRMFQVAPGTKLDGASIVEISRHPEMKKLMDELLALDPAKEYFARELLLESEKWFRVNAVRLKSAEQKRLGHVLVFHDMTELKRLETVRADFVANVSHELRTPLAAIKGYAETMLRSPPEDAELARQFLEVIDRHSERLGRLIDDLLTLSDLESGRVQIDREPVNPGDLIRKTLELLDDRARKKDVTLSSMLNNGVPSIPADPDRLQQLLINLIDNAIKYTPPGGAVKVSAKPSVLPESEQPMVELSVQDTGCGIPERDIPRLTERFYRVDKARSRELGGTGLGLAIVKHIVQAHHGFLKIESRLQQGTNVRVFLPRADSNGKPKTIVFLCTANSCRSQMAEGFARRFAPAGTAIYSAGTAPKSVHPHAIKVMREAGIDISNQASKRIDQIPLERADMVITLCGEASESCPALSRNADHLHWPLPDPASAQGDEKAILDAFRSVRDEIRSRVRQLFAS